MKFFFTFFILTGLHAKVLKHDSISARLHDFTYQDFCKTMQAKSDMLISAISLTEMECFNQHFKVQEFCIRKLPLGANFTRGFTVANEKKIYCEEAKSVMLTMSCDTTKGFCHKPQKSCQELKKLYAYSLEVTHASNVQQNLNCYFAQKIGEELDEI